MTDRLTPEIRRAVAELVGAAPLPPPLDLDNLDRRRRRRRRRRGALLAIPATALVMATVAATAIDLRGGGGHTNVEVGAPAPRGATPSTTVPDQQGPLPDPTFLTVADPPAGLSLVASGQSKAAYGPESIVLADTTGRSAGLFWTTTAGCGIGAPPTTLRPGSPGVDTTVARVGVLPTNPAVAGFVTHGNDGMLHWCPAGTTDVTLDTTGFDEAQARALAETVRPVPDDPARLTIDPPAGFAIGYPAVVTHQYDLAFRNPGDLSSKPWLTVSIEGAWTSNTSLLEAFAGASTAAALSVAGHQGYAIQLPGGATYQSLTIVYDPRTLVTLDGIGLTRDQLVAAAQSLTPADPSAVPDEPLCQQLGSCG